LSAGDFVLASASEGYTIDLAAHELMVVEFPRAALAARLSDLNDRLLRPICGASPGARIFHDYLLSLWRHGVYSGEDGAWQQGVSDAFFDLAALAIRGADTAPDRRSGGALREKLEALVESRLGDPELRTGAIADALRVSPRTVQNLFAAMGTTPSLYVLERRLNQAGDLLRADPSASITAVAFDLGFNDSAYFTRCFRRRFGTTPSAWRARH
jgi:AraC-like DNA-binding protein